MAKIEEKNGKSLVIVESPAKAKTIEKYLGSDYIVTSSIGHIRDLPKKNLSIDIEHGFKPLYEVSADKKKLVAELKSMAKKSSEILLATDEDREGEAIAWHLSEILGLDASKTKRIVFHEITKKAISDAIQKPRFLDLNLVNAQQARRVLDRLVGYELSPVLWKKVQRGLSAGRVQSVAVRVIVDREKEIENFVPESNFRLLAEFLTAEGKKFSAELKTRFKSLLETEQFLNSIIKSEFKVSDISIKPGKRTPSAPFTTSTLQQEAARKLGFSVKQTMVVAQKLYESGKITYMRTDSLNLSEFALDMSQEVISNEFGSKYHKRRKYITKDENAQEAHEAIRPTDFNVKTITGDKNSTRLYDLIWKRAVASQMADAELEKTVVSITISNSKEIFQANGEVIKFDGFLKLYLESSDDDSTDSDSDKLLPKMHKDELLNYDKISAKEAFKNPPARYSEASLVKKLEEMGIGRPSTYAPTISTIIDRGYVLKEDREGKIRSIYVVTLENYKVTTETKSENYGTEKSKLFPTSIGIIVTDFLVKHFKDIVDFNFTAKIEQEFDEIATGHKIWNKMIEDFYNPFKDTVEKSNDIKRSDAVQSQLLGIDPKSGKPVYAKMGRFGPMLQLGDGENDEKLKFASLPKSQLFDQINLDEALKLFDLPHLVGLTPDGLEVLTQKGRFGPYIKCGSTFASISDEEIFTISLDEAIAKINDKIIAKNNSIILSFEQNENLKVLKGRFGPYISDGNVNVKVPKGSDPAALTYDECTKLIENSGSKKTFKSNNKTVSKVSTKTASKTNTKTSPKAIAKAGKSTKTAKK